MSFYLLFFLLIIIIGMVVSYIYFMKEKKAQLMAIERGICPKYNTTRKTNNIFKWEIV